MTFQPIVARELRVAARKRSTFWLRVVAALVAMVIASGFLLLSLVSPVGGPSTTSLGKALFTLLTWLSLGVALCAGLFFTSDCLSEEKREGTLGFLFLTDLRGYDVVLGKLLATSLRGAFALLAVFPILAMTMLMGGVAGPEFWKTVLALLNALVFSLAGGLFVSSVSRDSQRAMAATLCLLLFVMAGGPIVDVCVAGANRNAFRPFMTLASPAYVFVTAGRWSDMAFWSALLTSQATAGLLLSAACALTPRTWQEKATKTLATRTGWSYWWRYGGEKRRLKLRRKLMDSSPILWLACRERWQSLAAWTMTLLVVGLFIYALLAQVPTEAWMAWSYLGGGLTLMFYLAVASQAGRFFIEARRSGLVELLSATPLPAPELARSQWRALLRLFALPVALFLGVGLIAGMLSQAAWGGLMSGAGGAAPGLAFSFATAVSHTVVNAANLIALSWFGMWMGLTSRNANLATLKTLLFVQVIPWFIIVFASSAAFGLLMFKFMVPSAVKGTAPNTTNLMLWYPLITTAVTGVLSLGKDVVFAVWARRKLYSDFRERVLTGSSPPRPPPALANPR